MGGWVNRWLKRLNANKVTVLGYNADVPNLFTYGVLRDPEVQTSVFGRTVAATPDSLRGYKLVPGGSEIGGEHFDTIVCDPSTRECLVAGLALDLTDEELKKSDIFETDKYRRETVKLESGAEAYVFVRTAA